MRILIVTPYFYPAQAFGGSVEVAFNTGKELVKRGHEVAVFTSDAKDRETRIAVQTAQIDGMSVHYHRNLSMFLVKKLNLFITPGFRKSVESSLRSFDLIHLHEYTTHQNVVIHRFAKKYGIPYVLQVHGSLPKIGRKGRKWLYDVFFGRRLLRDASKVIALNQMEAEQYRNIGVPEEKIAVIPNGIDLLKYTDLKQKGSFRKKFGIDGDKKIILYLGRIHRTKRIDLLVKAYACFKKSIKSDHTILVIAGRDDGYFLEIKSLVDSLGISESVIFTGFINGEDKFNALVDANVFVTPSFYGFPMTFLEACIVGTPIIATTLGDRLDWINGNVGYVTHPILSEIAESIHRIICNDELHDKFSRNCKEVVKSAFSLKKVVDELEQTYRKIVGIANEKC